MEIDMTADISIVLANHEAPDTVWLRRDLQVEGFRVLAASDGAAALNLLRGEGPSLLLMGLVPPAECSTEGAPEARLDSFQLLRQVRLESSVGVIVLSRERSEVIKLYFLDSGADDYLTWPYNRRELLARIRAVVRRGHDSAQGSQTTRSTPIRKANAPEQACFHSHGRDGTSVSR
jgi:DNA-binding response OmpR family regulator